MILRLLAFVLCFAVPLAAQTARFHTNAGDINVTLMPAAAPATVANFLNYVNSGAYNNSFIHRSAPNFVIQGGGYRINTAGNVEAIPANPPVMNEYNLSNTRGTIAMAKVGSDPNSATNQWFFNLVDNSSNLNTQNGGFTVFGVVADAASLAVMDRIGALPTDSFAPPFDQLPVFDTTQPASGNNLVNVLSITQTGVSSLAISAGAGQATAINKLFSTPLQVVVTNAGAPVANVEVTFTAPLSGAGGTFAGTTTVLTNTSGIATAPPFTANSTVGSFTVSATINGMSATFPLTNTAFPKINVGFDTNGTFAFDSNGTGMFDTGDAYFSYVSAQPGDIAVTGDWNGDGRTKAGIYRNGFWILDYNGNGVYDYPTDKFYSFGGPSSQGFVPVVGDWNGDGKSKIGYYQHGFWALDYNGNGSFDGTGAGQDRFIAFGGNANEFPLLGDWNHDGHTKIGVFYNGNFVLDYNGDGLFTSADKYYPYLSYTSDDRPIVGDWSGDGSTKIGIYRKGFWILDFNGNGIYDYPSDKFYAFGGNAGEVPLVGDWTGDGRTKIGYYLNGFWALDYNANGSFDGTGPGQDRFLAFGGNPGEQPVIGKW